MATAASFVPTADEATSYHIILLEMLVASVQVVPEYVEVQGLPICLREVVGSVGGRVGIREREIACGCGEG